MQHHNHHYDDVHNALLLYSLEKCMPFVGTFMYIVYANANITHLEVKIASISTYMQQTIPMGTAVLD